MKHKMLFTIKVVLLSLVLVKAAFAGANQGFEGTTFSWQLDHKVNQIHTMMFAANGITKEVAVKKAQKAYPGKLLQAEKMNRKGKMVFKVKLLSANSRVQVVYVDAQTGEIITK